MYDLGSGWMTILAVLSFQICLSVCEWVCATISKIDWIKPGTCCQLIKVNVVADIVRLLALLLKTIVVAVAIDNDGMSPLWRRWNCMAGHRMCVSRCLGDTGCHCNIGNNSKPYSDNAKQQRQHIAVTVVAHFTTYLHICMYKHMMDKFVCVDVWDIHMSFPLSLMYTVCCDFAWLISSSWPLLTAATCGPKSMSIKAHYIKAQ